MIHLVALGEWYLATFCVVWTHAALLAPWLWRPE